MRRAGIFFTLLTLLIGLAVFPAGAASTWSTVYTGEEDGTSLLFGADVVESHGGYFATSSISVGNAGQFPAVLFVTSGGDVAWAKRLGGWGNGGPPSMDAAPAGGVVLAAGHTARGEPGTKLMRVIRLNARGDVVWDKSYDPAAGRSIRALRNGGFVMAGHFRFNDTGVEGPSVIRLGADGSVDWQAAYPMGWDAYPADIQELPGGDLLVVGTTRTVDRYQEMWAMRLLGDGSVVWATDYGGPGMERGSAVVVSGDGRIFLAGSTTSRSDSAEGFVLISAAILELTPRGEIVAQMALRGNETGSVTDLDLTPRATLVVAGVEQPIGRRIWAAEIDYDWNLLWKRQYAVATFGANVRSTSDGGFIVGSSALRKHHRPWLLKLDRAGGVAGQDCELDTTVIAMTLEARERAVEPIYTETTSREWETSPEDVPVTREATTFSCSGSSMGRILGSAGRPPRQARKPRRLVDERGRDRKPVDRRVSEKPTTRNIERNPSVDDMISEVAPQPTGGREIRTPATSPTKMTARVEVASSPDDRRRGTLEVTWVDATTWKQELSLDEYRRTLTVVQDSRWVEQNATYSPLWTFDLDRLLEFDGGSAEACVESRTGVLQQMSYSENLAPGVLRRSVYRFEKAVHFAGTQFPSQMELTVGSQTIVTVEIEKVETLPARMAKLTRPAGLRTSASCRRWDPAIEVEQRQSPAIPSGGETAAVRFVVAKDGSLHDFEVLGPDDSNAGSSLVDRLRLELWLPARCDGLVVDSMAIVIGQRTADPPD